MGNKLHCTSNWLIKLQILSSTFKPSYLPLSILKSWALILNFVYEHARGHLIHWYSVAVATMTWLHEPHQKPGVNSGAPEG
jgi:hypothetical protein